MAFILNYRLLFRGGPETEWVDHDPVLLSREPGINTTTGGMKIGDGRKKWSQLDYVFGGEDYDLTPGTVTSGAAAAATITGNAPHQKLNLTLPYGPRGLQGDKGDTGLPGPAPTFTAGPVTTSTPGTAAAATVTGSNGAYVLNLTIPRGNPGLTGQTGEQGIKGDKGERGDKGEVGPSTNIAIGTVTTSTTTPNATITGTAPNQTLNLAIPRGDKGETGLPGPGNTITPGTITTGAPGTNAAATITGNSPNQALNLTIPRGDRGQIGPPGPAPTLTAAAPTNLPPGSTPTATISGTDGTYTLALGLPRGYDGSGVPGGGATGQLLRKNSVTDYDVQWFTPTWAPAAHTHTWTEVTEKPAAYPPSTHTHTYEDMIGSVPAGQLPWASDSTPGILDPVLFQRIVGANPYNVEGTLVRRDAAGRAQFADPAVDGDVTSKRYVDTGLAGKANTTHTHAWTEVTGKPSTFTPATHTHTTADVTGLTAALAGKAPTTHTHVWADLTDKPATFTPAAHTHATTDVTGLDTALAGKAAATHTHAWADVTGKPTTFAPTTHNHTAAQITTGTLDPARLPLSTTATAGAMSPADKTKLDGITGSGGGTSLTPTETTTLATLTDALTKTTTERTAYTTYQNLLDQKTVAGTVLTTNSAEDGAAKWNLNFQSTLETNPALADDGSSYIRLPANNNNANTGKPVHAYLLQTVSVTTGRTYALRARVRSTGTVGADDYFRILIGRYSGSGTPAYVNAGDPILMAPKGVNANGYVDIVGTWTANVTDANIVFAVQGGFLDNDLLVDRVSVLDTTGAVQVTDQQVNDARTAWQTAAVASNAAWRNMMPVGALTGGGGGVTTQTISRADYEARRAAGTLDPNILYMVSAA